MTTKEKVELVVGMLEEAEEAMVDMAATFEKMRTSFRKMRLLMEEVMDVWTETE